ncbi:MAG: carbohydrate binding family 9 domain-containing protein [Acidobacteria bacterium]|nr:carbohydrate binding family 9 domain-containing protein [Acidobacteriota bacterium]
MSARIFFSRYVCPVWVFLGLLAVVNVRLAAMQNSESVHDRYRYRTVFVETPPSVDGDLSDAVWEQAEVIDLLVQQTPHFGEPAMEKTELRVVYDSEAIYVAAYCYEADPSKRVANILTYREDQIHMKDDVIRVAFDPFHDHRRAYAFSVNALSTKADGYVDNRSFNNDWDEVWDVQARIHEDGWSAEFRIPFRILRFPPGENQTWGFEINRRTRHNNEQDYWAPHPPPFQLNGVEYYGHLEGISPTQPRRNVQFLPYVTTQVNRIRGVGGVDPEVDWGGDMKVVLGTKVALDLTYNTNFAQVEADDQQTNLTRFSLFFPEKREFFLESSQVFEYGINRDTQLFFSRRIGLVGGTPVPILGGARMTGKLGAMDFGLISTQTEGTAAAPNTNLSAARLRWNVGARSYIGGIFTSLSSDVRENRAFGPDALFWLSRNLKWESFIAAVDDPSLSKQPVSYSSVLNYNSDLWTFNARTLYVDDQFNPSLGFVRRQDIRRQEASFRKGWRLNRPWSRKFDFSGDLSYATDRQGDPDTKKWTLEASNELESGDILTFSLEGNFERLGPKDAFVINERDKISVLSGDYTFNRWNLGYESYEGRWWVANLSLNGGDFYDGTRTGLNLSGTLRPSPRLLLDGQYELNRISLPQGEFATHLWRARINVPFTARAQTDVFLQWSNLNQDGEREMNTQVRFRLIYGRDSNMFLVFTDQKRQRGNGQIERDQAVLLKLTYRLYL